MKNNITRSDLDLVIDLLKKQDPRLTNGPIVEEFEAKWSEWLGTKYSTFVSSGSASNFITLQILRMKYPEGGEVIVPPLTWISDIAAVIHHGFTPVFVDIDFETLGMNCKQVLSKLTDKTRAVFITHVQGFDALTDDLISELKTRKILLIEDVCESHGASHAGRKLGTFGAISNFSFFYAHHMSTIEGGMICTDDEEIYEWSRILRSHGMVRESKSQTLKDRYKKTFSDLNPDFIFASAAFNFRNNEIGGTIGINQLRSLDKNNAKRTSNFLYMLDRLDPDIYMVDFKREGSSNYAHQIILKHEYRDRVDELMGRMKNSGIEFRRGSAGGGNQLRQPYLKPYLNDLRPSDFPKVDHVHFYGFYIGNYPTLSQSDMDEILKVLNNWKS